MGFLENNLVSNDEMLLRSMKPVLEIRHDAEGPGGPLLTAPNR